MTGSALNALDVGSRCESFLFIRLEKGRSSRRGSSRIAPDRRLADFYPGPCWLIFRRCFQGLFHMPVQEAPRRAQDAPKTRPRRPRGLQERPRGPKTTPKPSPRGLMLAPWGLQKQLKNNVFLKVFRISSRLEASCLGMPFQDGQKSVPDRPKMAPRSPKSAPRRSKASNIGPTWGPRGGPRPFPRRSKGSQNGVLC